MIDFIKGMGTFLKNQKPSAGTQKISELVDEVLPSADENEMVTAPSPDLYVEMDYTSQQMWQDNQDINMDLAIDLETKVLAENNSTEFDDMILEKLTTEIFLNQDFINNLCRNVANILTRKITSIENIIDDELYKDRLNKFLVNLNPLITKELEDFIQEECILEKTI